MRFDKPIGILLLLWPTLWGVWAASQGRPSLKIFIIFIVGTVVMRAAGCIINDIADRNVDGYVKRTQQRPLVSGVVSLKEAWYLFFLCLILAFCLILFLNQLAIFLAFFGVGLTVLYPFTKRWIDAPQFILGFAFAWGIPMAYAAIQNSLPWTCWWLFSLTVILAVAYDTLYAMVDRDDDVKIGIKSTAILFGSCDKLIVFSLQLIVWMGLLLFGFWQNYSIRYKVWIFFSLSFFIYHHFLIKDREREKCFQAFSNHHWFVFWVWLGFVFNFAPVSSLISLLNYAL